MNWQVAYIFRIHIIRDVNDITDDNKDTQRKKRGSKGWYDMETGEVYLVLPNAESIADAQATILHEVVAHKGLRGLLGEKFDDMMDSVYRNLPEDVRRKVTRAGLSRYGGRLQDRDGRVFGFCCRKRCIRAVHLAKR